MLGKHKATRTRKNLPNQPKDARSTNRKPGSYVDDNVVWNGYEMSFSIGNDTEYPRWYRITIANLRPQEYALQFEVDGDYKDPTQLIEMAPREQGNGLLVLQHPTELNEPREFEIILTEFKTRDENGPRDILGKEKFEWVPIPKADDIRVEVKPRRAPIRPWRKEGRLEMVVSNRGFFPVTAELELKPRDANKKTLEQLEPIQISITEPLEPFQEEIISLTVPLETLPKKEPIRMEAVGTATIRGPEEPMSVSSKRTADLTYVPFLRAFVPDWPLLGLGLILITWLLFGLPPFYKKEPRVIVWFEGHHPGELPAGVNFGDLDVKFKIPNTTIKPFVPEEGKLKKIGDKQRAEYVSYNGVVPSPFRFTAPARSLQADGDPVVPKKGVQSKLFDYDFKSPLYYEYNRSYDEKSDNNGLGNADIQNYQLNYNGFVQGRLIVYIPKRTKDTTDVTVDLSGLMLQGSGTVRIEPYLDGSLAKDVQPKEIKFTNGQLAEKEVVFKLPLSEVSKFSYKIPGAKPEMSDPIEVKPGQSAAKTPKQVIAPPPPPKDTGSISVNLLPVGEGNESKNFLVSLSDGASTSVSYNQGTFTPNPVIFSNIPVGSYKVSIDGKSENVKVEKDKQSTSTLSVNIASMALGSITVLLIRDANTEPPFKSGTLKVILSNGQSKVVKYDKEGNFSPETVTFEKLKPDNYSVRHSLPPTVKVPAALDQEVSLQVNLPRQTAERPPLHPDVRDALAALRVPAGEGTKFDSDLKVEDIISLKDHSRIKLSLKSNKPCLVQIYAIYSDGSVEPRCYVSEDGEPNFADEGTSQSWKISSNPTPPDSLNLQKVSRVILIATKENLGNVDLLGALRNGSLKSFYIVQIWQKSPQTQ